MPRFSNIDRAYCKRRAWTILKWAPKKRFTAKFPWVTHRKWYGSMETVTDKGVTEILWRVVYGKH